MILCGTEGRDRTGTPVKEPDFESGASTSSATPARKRRDYSSELAGCPAFNQKVSSSSSATVRCCSCYIDATRRSEHIMDASIQTIPVTNLLIAFVPVALVLIIMLTWVQKTGQALYAIARMVLQLVVIG